jgi:protein-S-isoprenylcysteine O-methyltransferase Ste14
MKYFTQGLIPAQWLLWALYWVVASFNVKRTVRRESALSRAAHFVPLGLAGWLLATPTLSGWLGARWLPRTWMGYEVGVTLVALGLAFAVWARIVLAGNWSGSVTLKDHHDIVQTGPYRFIRHPIYTGLVLAFFGSALARGEWRGLVAVAIVVAALWRKWRLEERWLEESFGATYATYRKTTWALIPFLL